jgi:hypothetical protein
MIDDNVLSNYLPLCGRVLSTDGYQVLRGCILIDESVTPHNMSDQVRD